MTAIEPTNVVSGAERATAEDAHLPDTPDQERTEDDAFDDSPALYGGRIASVIADAVTFTIVVARLAVAATAMRMLSQAVKGAYDYVTECAETVDQLADTAASLKVDPLVTSAHHDAASITRGALEDAESLANEAAEMASVFDQAAEGHDDDYGMVNETMQSGEYDIAEREWYSNR